jgi:hypothetical protein
MILKIKQFIPKKLDHRDVFVKDVNGFLEIRCNKVRPPKPIMIKKRIKLDESFFEVIGLYFGDGVNSRKGSGNRRVALANTCPKLHNVWLSFLEKFGIDRKQTYAQIQIGTNFKTTDSKLFRYWSKKTKIPLDSFCKKINVKEVKTKKYGVLVSNFNSYLFRKIFDKLFDFSLSLCKENNQYAVAFLRGLFAAEGYVHINKYKSLAWLDLPIKDGKRRKFVEFLFKQLEINPSNRDPRLIITGYFNFEKCYAFRLIDLHPIKIKSFKKGYNHLILEGNVPALTKIKIINSLKQSPKDRFQIAKEVNSSISVIHKALRDLEIKEIVERSSRSLSRNNRKRRQIWSLVEVPEDFSVLTKRDYCSK